MTIPQRTAPALLLLVLAVACLSTVTPAVGALALSMSASASVSSTSSKGLVVVTGGSRGIGAATCRLLASRGYDVAVNYRSGEEEARAVCVGIDALRSTASTADNDSTEKGGTAGGGYVGSAFPIKADVSVEADVAHLFESVQSHFGTSPTGLVNNAGILGPTEADVVELSREELDGVLATNVYGPFFCCREFVKRVSTKRGGKGGAIVNVSSGSAYTGRPLLYAMSKGALDSMMAGLSQSLPSEGIRINAVAPGVTETDMVTPDMIEKVVPIIPMGRAGRPEEIAEVIAFLLGDGGGGYCCGAKVRAAGGRP